MTAKGMAGITVSLLAVWIATTALVMRFSNAAPAAIVMFPDQEFLSNIPPRSAVIGKNSFSITLGRSDVKALVKEIYAAGGMLVLPAGLKGCFTPRGVSAVATTDRSAGEPGL